MNHPQLPVESDQKQKDFYLQLRDKINKWFEKNAGPGDPTWIPAEPSMDPKLVGRVKQ